MNSAWEEFNQDLVERLRDAEMLRDRLPSNIADMARGKVAALKDVLRVLDLYRTDLAGVK